LAEPFSAILQPLGWKKGEAAMANLPITRENFSPVGFTAILYTRPWAIKAADLIKWLPDEWSDRLPEPQVLPVQPQFPPEIPHVLWQADDLDWSIAVSRAQFWLGWRSMPANSAEISPPASFFERAVELIKSARLRFDLKGFRTGCLCNRRAPLVGGAKALAAHFCKDEWINDALKRPESFELHSHKLFKFASVDVTVNSWMRVKALRMMDGTYLVLTEQDFNTPVEPLDTADFGDSELDAFFGACAGELDRVLDRYFPGAAPQ
jgi:hypothetical protein